jgi:hypothetical protein
MTQETAVPTTSRARGQAPGLLAAGAGVAIALAVYLHPENLRVPAWVAYAAALAFFFAGCQLLARHHGQRLLQAWLPAALVACLVAPPLWIAFGAGPRRCGFELATSVLRLFGVRSDLLCRVGFGIGAVLGLAILLLAIHHALRTMRAMRADD